MNSSSDNYDYAIQVVFKVESYLAKMNIKQGLFLCAEAYVLIAR